MPVQLQMDKLVFERRSRGGETPQPEPVSANWSWEQDHR
jgi:hypothetical protein